MGGMSCTGDIVRWPGASPGPGIALIAEGIARVFDAAGDEAAETKLALENAAGGGWSVGVSIDEMARIADAAAAFGITGSRLGFCLDTAHAWGAGIAVDTP